MKNKNVFQFELSTKDGKKVNDFITTTTTDIADVKVLLADKYDIDPEIEIIIKSFN